MAQMEVSFQGPLTTENAEQMFRELYELSRRQQEQRPMTAPMSVVVLEHLYEYLGHEGFKDMFRGWTINTHVDGYNFLCDKYTAEEMKD